MHTHIYMCIIVYTSVGGAPEFFSIATRDDERPPFHRSLKIITFHVTFRSARVLYGTVPLKRCRLPRHKRPRDHLVGCTVTPRPMIIHSLSLLRSTRVARAIVSHITTPQQYYRNETVRVRFLVHARRRVCVRTCDVRQRVMRSEVKYDRMVFWSTITNDRNQYGRVHSVQESIINNDLLIINNTIINYHWYKLVKSFCFWTKQLNI